MKSYELYEPTSVQQAVGMLNQYGATGKALGGGSDLIGGITILALSALRLLWRLSYRPPPDVPMAAWQQRAAHFTHFALYLLFFLVPLAGWAYSSAAGFPIVALDCWLIVTVGAQLLWGAFRYSRALCCLAFAGVVALQCVRPAAI